jgi:hypothetical protein
LHHTAHCFRLSPSAPEYADFHVGRTLACVAQKRNIEYEEVGE